MRASRLMRVATVAGVAAMVLGGPAIAQSRGGSGYAWTETSDSSATVGAEDNVSSPVGPGRTGGSGGVSPCTWTRVEPDTVGEEAELIFSRMPNADYLWYLKRCTNPDGSQSSQFIPVEVAEAEPPPDPEALRARAVEELQLPSPSIAMSPPGDQIVHIASWLWLEDGIWQPHSSSASAGDVTATVTATPHRTLWDMGTGDVVVCAGPGDRYDPGRSDTEQASSCSHTYRNSSAGQPGNAYPVVVTVEWELGWTVTGAPGGGPLPALTTSTSTSVPVGELQALNQ
jgi:hypothetical protein